MSGVTMGTVLFAWELGDGLGHVGPMKVLAEHLAGRGHQCVFAVKNVIAGRAVLAGLGPILQSPMLSKPRTTKPVFGLGSFSDILAVHGFGEPRLLGPAVSAWSDLYDIVRPDIVIADFSPTALVAAYSRIPAVTVGYAFYLPPADLPQFPAFRDDVPPVLGEGAVIASIQQVLAQFGLSAPKTLPALFRGQYTHVYSLPQLDPYAAYRRIPGFGPIETMPRASIAPEDSVVFAYLAADHYRIADVAVALGELSCPVEFCLRDAQPSLLHFAARRGLKVHERPPPLAETIHRAKLVISHGGGGVAHAALLAGRPHLLLPGHAEAQTTAIMLENLRVGRRVSADQGAAAFRETVNQTLSNLPLTAASQVSAAVWANYHPRSRLDELIEACNELIGVSRGSRVC
jgi:hypothetical protein